LFVLLLYRQKRPPQLGAQLRRPAPRYIEPDSIPLEIRTGKVETDVETGTETEDVALAKARANKAKVSTPSKAAPSRKEGKTAALDDLKVIEGIGQTISGILHDSGIDTFRQLAEMPVDQLEQILSRANLRGRADPGSWPEQARLAAEGNWDGLKQLQGTLKGGRKTKPAE
jgi:small subunit ribosomal protein S2